MREIGLTTSLMVKAHNSIPMVHHILAISSMVSKKMIMESTDGQMAKYIRVLSEMDT